MKKFNVLVLTMVLVLAAAAGVSAQNVWQQGNAAVKMGIDFNGEIDFENGDTEDVESGISLTGEYYFSNPNRAKMGFGLTYQFDRAIDEDGADDWNFVPVYGLVKVTSVGNSKYQPYFLGQLGYNFFNEDFSGADGSGGMYYGIGAGFEVSPQVDVEMLYSVNKGELDYDNGGTEDVDYSKLRLGVSYSF